MLAEPAAIEAVLKPTAGYVLALGPRRSSCTTTVVQQDHAYLPDIWDQTTPAPPDAAMSAKGDVAFAERPARRCGRDRIVLESNGSRTILMAPRPPGPPYASDDESGLESSVSRVKFADDGTLFVTITTFLSGAYDGTFRSTFEMFEGTWHRLTVNCGSSRDCGTNVSLGAAKSSTVYQLALDDQNWAGIDMSKLRTQIYYLATRAYRISNGVRYLGVGYTNDWVGHDAVGYATNYARDAVPQAVRWNGTRRTLLGNGVAYAIDANGTAVGDDRSEMQGVGMPVRWARDRSRQELSPEAGSALAIARGVIVGSVSSRAFFYRDGVIQSVSAPRFAMLSAFAIDQEGSIAALASAPDGRYVLVKVRLRKEIRSLGRARLAR